MPLARNPDDTQPEKSPSSAPNCDKRSSDVLDSEGITGSRSIGCSVSGC